MNPRKHPLRLGLTGGIGSGKSTVGHVLASLGASLIDADQIAREVTGPHGAAMEAIRATFGSGFVDASGALDRGRMRALAFSRPEARAQLEGIVHPLVTLHGNLKAEQAAHEGHALIVFDIPLLAESDRWARRLDAVLVVDCSAETQIERVMQRNGLTREVVLGIIASQASRPARRAVADAVIANGRDCTLENLHAQTRQAAALFGL
ncbi:MULTISPECIES: dephospho-CoA kinase [unclassified Acidovorax]|uniref:dephospho-CoA kinase n=1 Tax=unclassified Acidovorax TaxID=2684926 RepID=UPI001C4753B5|nr:MULTISPECIES: dephospho-CoA kinase [unclassified Acidovorax]MBV7428452.1 dephospho-CoA kinase [Acidovorax sp. sif0732]MBV7450278.1 dephospho-CoA kinase [Acidovorax sp. sif0715]